YFSSNNTAVLNSSGLAAIADGWSARLAAGLGLALAGGARMSLDTELGGIGSATYRWTVRGRWPRPSEAGAPHRSNASPPDPPAGFF
ncbi:hypothetical protein, partial [Klebsiella variicola]|uniref:hypothetical protein n=1 Tax=Klebsiella variicola TaxID=244366 RepID=UPI0019537E39